jgi:hypothetical protein
MYMRTFIEFELARVEKEFINACEATGVDPKKRLMQELDWSSVGRWFGFGGNQQAQAPAQQRQPASLPAASPAPNDQGVMLPSNQGTRHFANNQSFSDAIGKELKQQVTVALSNTYKSFMQQYPGQNSDKVKTFFNQLSSRLLTKVIPELMAQAKTTVDGEKVAMGDPNMQKMAQGKGTVGGPAPTNVPLRQPQATKRRNAQLAPGQGQVATGPAPDG